MLTLRGLVVVGLISSCIVFATGTSTALSEPLGIATLFDRTFACAIDPIYDNVRAIEVGVGPKRDSTVQGAPGRPAAGGVNTRISGEGNSILLALAGGPLGGRSTGEVAVKTRRCTWLKRSSIPLSAKGLPGPAVRYEKTVECLVPRRILVRVRATLRRRANLLAVGDGVSSARADVLEAQFAVRTLPDRPARRKPLAFGVIGKTGETKLYYAPQCE